MGCQKNLKKIEINRRGSGSKICQVVNFFTDRNNVSKLTARERRDAEVEPLLRMENEEVKPSLRTEGEEAQHCYRQENGESSYLLIIYRLYFFF